MLLVKSITPKKINVLSLGRYAITTILIACFFPAFSQDNSPYTRYGLGDIVPSTNINSRAMGGISAAYTDPYGVSINFNNPASFSRFQTTPEPNSKSRIRAGRAVLDVGINLDYRTLREQDNSAKFTSSNILFSHVQVGMPISQKWGFSFGLRPLTRIAYKIAQFERIFDPNTGANIDSAFTQYEGEGGTYLVSGGIGIKLVDNKRHYLSIGGNAGYQFGEKDYSTKRIFINDTVDYYRANYETKTSLGNWHFDLGIQYKALLDSAKGLYLGFGAYGNLQNIMRGVRDEVRETYVADPTMGNTQLDSVSEVKGVVGDVIYPASYTVGFTLESMPRDIKKAGWMFGVDYNFGKWSDYRYYGQKDSTQDKWELRMGGELRPAPAGKNYFSYVTYRAGFFVGEDYIKVKESLPLWGATFGMALPLSNQGMRYGTPNQSTMINLAFEYIKRGKSDNLLRDNIFRVSFGMSLSDLWFLKRKYE